MYTRLLIVQHSALRGALGVSNRCFLRISSAATQVCPVLEIVTFNHPIAAAVVIMCDSTYLCLCCDSGHENEVLKPAGGHEKFYGKGVLLESRYYQLNKSMLQTFRVNYSEWCRRDVFLLHRVVTQKAVIIPA